METSIRLIVLTMGGPLLDSNADYVSLDAEDGSIGILKGHQTSLIALKSPCKIMYRLEGQEHNLEIGGGIAEIKDDIITVFG